MAVSYYFDESVSKNSNIDPAMYIAGGIACWDLVDQGCLFF